MIPHQVLGVASCATPEQIKSAYRKLAMQHHPDKHNGSDEAQKKFQEIQAAYEMLRNDKPRQQSAPNHQHFNAADMHSAFEEMFRRQQQQMHATLHAFAEITLQQAFEGCSVNFNLPTGKSVQIDFPKGVRENQNFVVQNIENPNGPPQSLQVVVRIIPNESFHRRGDDLLCKIDVDVIDAITGCEKELTGIDGAPLKVIVPANSHPQSSITIANHGMPMLNDPTKRGNLMVYLDITFRAFNDEELFILRGLKKS